MDLRNSDARIDDEDQTIILMCSLLNSDEHFLDTIICGRDTLFIKDVTQRIWSRGCFESREDESGESFVARGRTVGIKP